MPLRMDKINSQLKRSITEIVQQEIDDPNLGIVSITRVNTTRDLSEAKVYFSVLNDNFSKVDEVFDKMGGFIRSLLSKKVRLKRVPKLFFVADDSMKYSVDICKKIEEVTSAEESNRYNQEQ